MNFKDNLLTTNKYWIYFILILLAYILYHFQDANYQHPEMEIIAFIVLSLASIFVIVYFQSNSDDKNLYKTAFIIILVFGLIFSLASPICVGPDEVEHFIRSEMTSRGEFIPEYVNGSYQTIQSCTDLIEDNKIHYDNGFDGMLGKATIFNTNTDTKPINHTLTEYPSAFAQNPFYGYLAPAIGILIAKLFNMNAIWMVWLGRMFNVVLYAGLSAIAIKKTPILKMPMLVFACIPLAIFLGATTSIDAFINGMGLVTMSYFFYMYKASENELTKRHILTFTAFVILLGLAKLTCFAFILLLPLIPKGNFKNEKDYYLNFVAIAVALAAAVAWTRIYANPGFLQSWRGNAWAIQNYNSTRQMDYILHHPTETVSELLKMPLHLPSALSFSRNFEDFFDIMYIPFIVLTVFLYPKDTENIKSRIGALLVSLIFYVSTYVSFMLAWCEVGVLSNYYLGVQIRYFYPMLSLLPFIFNIRYLKARNQNLDSWIITAVLLFISFRVLKYIIPAY